MLYFKNNELAETHRVTLRTVQNWVQAAKEGKLDLTLHTENGKSYVANTARNIATIKRLVEERRKYRNTKAVRTVMPRPEFYEIYNEGQIFDLISNIETHHEIPMQYNYFDGGAGDWDTYAQRLVEEDVPNNIKGSIKLLAMNQGYIDELLEPYTKVNVIDIGVGNAYPVKDFLAHLVERGKLGRYVALDISPAMLKIAEHHVKKWFGDKVAFEGYEVDINYDRFSKLLVDEYLEKKSEKTINLSLLLGGTLTNMRNPDGGFRVIHDSMGVNDLLVHTRKLDTEHTRRYFDFDATPGKARLAPIFSFVVSMLNIDPAFYEVEMGYDPETRQRFERIRFTVGLTIEFDFPSGGTRSVSLHKGEAIRVWRAVQQTADDVREQFEKNELYPLHTSQTQDQEYMLTIARVKRG